MSEHDNITEYSAPDDVTASPSARENSFPSLEQLMAELEWERSGEDSTGGDDSAVEDDSDAGDDSAVEDDPGAGDDSAAEDDSAAGDAFSLTLEQLMAELEWERTHGSTPDSDLSPEDLPETDISAENLSREDLSETDISVEDLSREDLPQTPVNSASEESSPSLSDLEAELRRERRSGMTRRLLLIPLVLIILAAIAGSVWYCAYYRPQVLIPRQQYREATELLANGEWDDAREIFVSLGDYEDCARMIRECDYGQADQLLSEGHWSEAKDLFDSLGDYLDSSDRAIACEYFHGLLLLQNESYEDSAAVFELLGDYGDCPSLLVSAWYQLGRQEEAAGNDDKARECYEKVGDYEDAEQRLKLLDID